MDCKLALPPDPHASEIEVDVLAGCVLRKGIMLHLTPTELAFAMLLALHPHGCERFEIAEILFRESETRSSSDSVKVLVHRIRRKCGSFDFIATQQGRYRLNHVVKCDVSSVEHNIAIAKASQGTLDRDTVEKLERYLNRLKSGTRFLGRKWEWFAPLERVRERLTYDILLALGSHAMAMDQPIRALELASSAQMLDEFDEGACRLVVVALRHLGDERGAHGEVKRFAQRLSREGLGISEDFSLSLDAS